MKVVGIDSYARDTIADTLVEENLDEQAAITLVERMNSEAGENPSRWYVMVEDDYRLSRGMEDLV
jgi:hypothetical protein